ncbi:Bug family tripartite tricarboxylate transporter substrate binding protein [Falsirhodobacter xinxiangensis]|uniref:Bug family tripartite tricarboxylate transporter substrate binding protein n=1 Tax=Falsirhodobacter xinxiangensis TaxID=2530049 RepID=UPI00145BD954|nr:tripartite tricarboxylate transporter substrate binding protein [Rhodobacter xinxiangensis]
MREFIITRRKMLVCGSATALTMTIGPTRAVAQSYPSGDIAFMVGYGPGGHSDLIARSIGEQIQARIGNSVIVDYRPGGGGGIAGDLVSRAKPDGRTLLAISNTFYAVTPFLGHVQYDPLTDLTPVGFAGDGYLIAGVHPSIPVNSMQELVDYALANPGTLNYASNGQGSLTHLCGEYFKSRTGADIQHIAYRGAADAVQATIRNETQVNFSIGDASHHDRGELRAIASLGKSRWDRLPDVMSTDESGLPGWAIRSWHGVAVPKDTPAELCQQLNDMVNEIVAMPEVAERLAMLGLHAEPQTLAQLDARRREDHAAFGAVIEAAGLKAE